MPALLSKKDCDLMRTLASVMVVVAHCIHPWVKRFPQAQEFFTLNYFGCLLDQLTRFTVPLFLFLSGVGLTAQYIKKNYTVGQYYKKRLPKIIAPFLLWSFITSFRHVDYFGRLPWAQSPLESLGSVLHFMFLRGFDYQYYFLIVLFQFYLLFPLFFKLRNVRWLPGFLLGAQLVYFMPFPNLLRSVGIELPSMYHNFISFYWIYCFMGVYLSANPGTFNKLLNKLSPLAVLGIWVGSFALLNFEFAYNIVVKGMKLYHTDHFNRATVVLYCFSSLLLVLKYRTTWLPKLYAFSAFSFVATHMAPFTYFVYLSHTHFLRFAQATFGSSHLGDMLLRTGFVLTASYALAWIFQSLLKPYPQIRYAFALPEQDIRPPWPRIKGLVGKPAFRIGALLSAVHFFTNPAKKRGPAPPQ